ncbi:hypothetical protein F4818DRAFT_237088 [Hypoxylon cercidicola]|nr:hypothetical protein F4818DRAFT_237088 [Hypoxylon cercidicola]
MPTHLFGALSFGICGAVWHVLDAYFRHLQVRLQMRNLVMKVLNERGTKSTRYIEMCAFSLVHLYTRRLVGYSSLQVDKPTANHQPPKRNTPHCHTSKGATGYGL